MARPKIALFGGSFNPPHISHQMIVFYLLNYKQFDEVHLIPAFKHPFGKELAEFEHRFVMCELLCKPFNGKAIVNGIERHLVEEGITEGHTIDTVREYVKRRPEYKITLVIGFDILKDIDKWKKFNEIKNLADVLVLIREGEDQVKPNSPGVLSPVWLHSIETFRKPEVSSTEIRKLIAAGKSIENLVPATVREYIQKNSLYI
jgi:nicotinate-nucleotide adenylyltransferase